MSPLRIVRAIHVVHVCAVEPSMSLTLWSFPVHGPCLICEKKPSVRSILITANGKSLQPATLRLGTTESFVAHLHFSILILSESSMGLHRRPRRPDIVFNVRHHV